MPSPDRPALNIPTRDSVTAGIVGSGKARIANIIPSMANPPLFRDPWAKRDTWRKHPVFSNRAMFSSMFPGFGIAAVAFTAYVIFDNVYGKAQSTKH